MIVMFERRDKIEWHWIIIVNGFDVCHCRHRLFCAASTYSCACVYCRCSRFVNYSFLVENKKKSDSFAWGRYCFVLNFSNKISTDVYEKDTFKSLNISKRNALLLRCWLVLKCEHIETVKWEPKFEISYALCDLYESCACARPHIPWMDRHTLWNIFFFDEIILNLYTYK